MTNNNKLGIILAAVVIVLGGIFLGQRFGVNLFNLKGDVVGGNLSSSGHNMLIIDGNGQWSLGNFINGTQALTDLYPGDKATFANNKMTWDDGSAWALASDQSSSPVSITYYKNQKGAVTATIQNGTTGNLAFIDGNGQWSLGHFLSAKELLSAGLNGPAALSNQYPGTPVEFSGTTATWTDGAVWTQIDRGGARDAGFEVMAPFIYTNPKGVPVYVVRRHYLANQDAVMGTYTAIPDLTTTSPMDNARDIAQKTCATAQPQKPFFAVTCQPGFILTAGPDSKPRSVET